MAGRKMCTRYPSSIFLFQPIHVETDLLGSSRSFSTSSSQTSPSRGWYRSREGEDACWSPSTCPPPTPSTPAATHFKKNLLSRYFSNPGQSPESGSQVTDSGDCAITPACDEGKELTFDEATRLKSKIGQVDPHQPSTFPTSIAAAENHHDNSTLCDNVSDEENICQSAPLLSSVVAPPQPPQYRPTFNFLSSSSNLVITQSRLASGGRISQEFSPAPPSSSHRFNFTTPSPSIDSGFWSGNRDSGSSSGFKSTAPFSFSSPPVNPSWCVLPRAPPNSAQPIDARRATTSNLDHQHGEDTAFVFPSLNALASRLACLAAKHGATAGQGKTSPVSPKSASTTTIGSYCLSPLNISGIAGLGIDQKAQSPGLSSRKRSAFTRPPPAPPSSSSRRQEAPGKKSKVGPGPHICPICFRRFTRSDMLVRHSHLHTGHRPFACSECGQSFTRSDHLSTHRRTHSGDRPYGCPVCPYSASRRDMITRHLRVHQRRKAIN